METFLYTRPSKKNTKINLWFSYGAIESFAMASSGYLAIFKDFDLDDEIFVERIYSDTKNPIIPPQNVDVMGFSVSFELDILTIIKMLKKYNFPLLSSQRNDSDPIIFAGGPVLMSNPEPYKEFFDFISIGEKTCLIDAFKILKNKNNKTRKQILEELSNVKGIYVPLYPKNEIEIVRDNIQQDIVYTPILSDKSYFKDTFIVEIERGCPKMCNFCLASWLNLPTRNVSYEKIIEAIDIGLKYTNKIALLGAYVAGHPRFGDILKYISNIAQTKPIELSISSIRADLADIELIKTLVKCNQKTATIALEAGSQRLRDLIKKDLTEQQILNTIKIAKLGGLKGLKIYIMLGLPTETQEDVEEFINLAKKMKQVIKETGPGSFELTFSASGFVPKILTPFENIERCDKKTMENRVNYLKKNFHKLGINFRTPSIEWDMVQSILSRYNKSLADFLIDVVDAGANLGAFKQTWRKYSKKGLLEPFEKAAQFPYPNSKSGTWDFINAQNEKLKTLRKQELNHIYHI